MKAKDIASKYKVSPATVKVWIRERKLKAKITPRGYEITEEQLKDFELNQKYTKLIGK
jgi:uncharacterized protein YjcR